MPIWHVNRQFFIVTQDTYLPTFESQKTEHEILRGSEATKPEGAKRPRGGGCGRGVSPLPR